jgi:hypothetical protein
MGDAYAVMEGIEDGSEVYSFLVDHALFGEIRARLTASTEP